MPPNKKKQQGNVKGNLFLKITEELRRKSFADKPFKKKCDFVKRNYY